MNPEEVLRLIAVMLMSFLRPFVAETVAEVHAQRDADEAKLGDRNRLWVPEAEAASSWLGLPTHRLRDCRRRGEIVGCKIGKTIGYERAELLRFLRAQRLEP